MSVIPALIEGRSRAVGVGFWVVVLVSGVILDVVTRGSEGKFATSGEALRLVSRPRAAQVALVGAWTFVGWHLFCH